MREVAQKRPVPALWHTPHRIGELVREHPCRNKEETGGVPPLLQDNNSQKGHKSTDSQAVKEDSAVAHTLQNDMANRFIDDVREETANAQ